MFPCCRPAQTELLFSGEKFSHRPTKTFDAEGEILEHPLTKSFRMRNDAIKGLCSSVRRFGKSTMNLQKFDGGWKIIASHTSIDDVIGLPRTTGPIPKHRPYDCLTQLCGILGKLSRLPHFRRHRFGPIRR
jgi:hypothetical protein